ncbi:MAG: metallophosphoesterase [Lewinella sp.]
MKIQYLSDLHLEFAANRAWLRENPIVPAGDILVVAGDTFYLGEHHKVDDFIRYVAKHFRQTYLIPGNHEYYGGFDVTNTPFSFRQSLAENVTMLNNVVEVLDGVRLIFSTMWSLIDRDEIGIMRGLNDFRLIQHRGKLLTVAGFNELHTRSMKFLRAELDRPYAGAKVVVTHHLPADGCNHPRFRGTLLNPAFCTDYTKLIEAADLAAWIYGHSHRNVADFELNGTKVLTNQLGYVQYGEQMDFSLERVLEV